MSDPTALLVEVMTRIRSVVTVPVEMAPPKSPPDRYVRIDGLSALDLELYRDAPFFDHSFMVHAFDAPAGGTTSLAWVIQTIEAIKTEILDIRIGQNGTSLRMDRATVTFDPRKDDGHDAHALHRYQITIGD